VRRETAAAYLRASGIVALPCRTGDPDRKGKVLEGVGASMA
jgi:hypothetical protein